MNEQDYQNIISSLNQAISEAQQIIETKGGLLGFDINRKLTDLIKSNKDTLSRVITMETNSKLNKA